MAWDFYAVYNSIKAKITGQSFQYLSPIPASTYVPQKYVAPTRPNMNTPTNLPNGYANPATWKQIVIRIDNEKFGGWFQRNNYVKLVVAMIGNESSFGANRIRENPKNLRDWSYGVLQVTMHPKGRSDRAIDELLNRGLIPQRPTKAQLISTYIGLWYGMIFIRVIVVNYRQTSYENIARAYNGWISNGRGTVNAMTNDYWNKTKKNLTLVG